MRSSELCRYVFIGLLAVTFLIHTQINYLYLIITFTTLANFFAASFNPALLTVPRQLDLPSTEYQKLSGLLGSSASIARR
jgi:hypothetical protein